MVSSLSGMTSLLTVMLEKLTLFRYGATLVANNSWAEPWLDAMTYLSVFRMPNMTAILVSTRALRTGGSGLKSRMFWMSYYLKRVVAALSPLRL